MNNENQPHYYIGIQEQEIMDLGDLNPAETLTPVAHKREVNIFEDATGEDAVTKIPHGLSAKKKSRRKSFEHFSSVSMLGWSARRAPLTAPRPNVFNSQPLSLDKTKRSLLSAFANINNDKEDVSVIIKPNKNSIAQSSPLPLPKKRACPSSDNLDDSEYKLPKLDHSFLNSKIVDNPFTKGVDENELEISDDEQELSRVEHYTSASLSPSDPKTVLENIMNDETEDKENEKPNAEEMNLNLSQESLQTPSRPTEPIAISPRTEQHSRVADESRLLLDTTKSPCFDDSYVAESPLTAQKDRSHLSILKDLERDEALQKKPNGHQNPSEVPYFTIKQFNEIQKDFQEEIERLEIKLKESIKSLNSLKRESTLEKIKISELQLEIDSLTLYKKQITKINELLQHEKSVYQLDIAKLEQSAKLLNERSVGDGSHINKLKDTIKELKQSIRLKDSQIDELQTNIATELSQIQTAKEHISELEQQNLVLSQSAEERDAFFAELQELKNKYEELNKVSESAQLETRDLKEKVNEKTTQLEEYETKVAELESKNSDLSLKWDELTKEKEALVEVNEVISSELHSLKHKLQNNQEFQNEKTLQLVETINAKEKSIKLNEIVIEGLNKGIATLKKKISSIAEELSSKSQVVTELTQKLEETKEYQELLIIRKAEVDELNIELKAAKNEWNLSRSTVEEKQELILKLNFELDEKAQTLQEKEELLQRLEEDINKAETEHIKELESLHQELSNLQSMAQAKSNESSHLKEDKLRYQSEIDLLKFQLSEAQRETSNYKASFSSHQSQADELKAQIEELNKNIKTLQDEVSRSASENESNLQQLAEDLYIQYSKKHEQKVAVLKHNFETKWQGKLGKVESENEKLRRELEGLKRMLEKEREEKNQVISIYDELIKEKNGSA